MAPSSPWRPRTRPRRHAWAGVGLLALASACATQFGGAWMDAEDAPEPRVAALVLGGADGSRATRALTTRFEAGALEGVQLALWLGHRAEGRRACKQLEKDRPTVEALARSLEGRPVYVAGSPASWRCDRDLPETFLRPAPHYVVDVVATGETRVVSRCEGDGCEVEAPTPSVLARLVIVDETPWAFPEIARGPEAEAAVVALDSLLEALPPAPDTPHILVTHLPIESSGSHGQGGWSVTSTFVHHAPIVRAALKGGRFDGVIAGHEGNLQLVGDLSDAVKRSTRVWLRRPVFQLVAGSSGDPDAGHAGPRRWTRFQGIALAPDHSSPRAGYGRLDFGADGLVAHLFSQGPGGWSYTQEGYAYDRPPHPVESPSPPMTPCRDCVLRDGAADRGQWFPGDGEGPP